jgi:hypothetical protein
MLPAPIVQIGKHLFMQTFQLFSPVPLSGPFSLVLNRLEFTVKFVRHKGLVTHATGVHLLNASGHTTMFSPAGDPFVVGLFNGNALTSFAGQPVVLIFQAPSKKAIGYTPVLLIGVPSF